MPIYTAAIALSPNGYTEVDITTADAELIIDKAINEINLLADISIPAMTGTAGSKTVYLSRDQSAAVEILVTLMLREAKKTQLSNSSSTGSSSGTSNSVAAGGISASESGSVSSSISAASSLNSATDFTRELFNKAIDKLRIKGHDWNRSII